MCLSARVCVHPHVLHLQSFASLEPRCSDNLAGPPLDYARGGNSPTLPVPPLLPALDTLPERERSRGGKSGYRERRRENENEREEGVRKRE